MGYIKAGPWNEICIALSAAWAFVSKLIFPSDAYGTVTVCAVMVMMTVDLLTKLFALSKQNGGLMPAIASRHINSKGFFYGTRDKIIFLFVMLIIGGCAYRIIPVEAIATWLMTFSFGFMFFRDLLSILENLSDAGVGGLDVIKKVIKKKQKSFIDEAAGGDIEEEKTDGENPVQ